MSRYVHLNPVRVRSLGLGKTQQQRIHAGTSSIPEVSVVEERVARLRRYRLDVGRRACGLKLERLAGAAGMTDYSTVSIAVRVFEKRLRKSQVEQDRFKQVCQLLNVEM